MPDEQADQWFRKFVLLALLLTWVILVLDLTEADPERWVLYGLTAVVFLIAGRMWDVELERFDVPGFPSVSERARENEDDEQ